MLLDVTALADEVVLGLLAGKAALALGAELGTDALGSAGNLALRNHGGENWWARPASIRGGVVCVRSAGSLSFQQAAEMDDAAPRPTFG